MGSHLPSRDDSSPGLPSARRRREHVSRQLGQLVAAIVVLALIGGGLLVVFRGGSEASRRDSDASFLAAAASPIATPVGQAPDLQSGIFESDNGAAQAYFAHLGVWPKIVKQVAGATVSVIWAYSDTNRAMILYTITARTDAHGKPLPPPFGPGCSLDVTLTTAPDAAPLGTGAGAMDEGGPTAQCLITQDLAAMDSLGKIVMFHLKGQVPALGTPSMPPEAMQNVMSRIGTPPDLDVPTGFFSADVTVPVLSARVAEPNLTQMLDGRAITLKRVVVTPSQMDIEVSGSAVGSGRTVESFSVNGLSPGPSNAISVAERRLSDGTLVISFGYPDYARTGEWSITIGPLVDYSVAGPPPATPVISPANSVTFHFTLPPAP